MIKLAYNKSEPNLVFEIEEICRVPMNGGIVEYYKGVLTDTSTIPDTHIENYMVQVMAFESDWAEVPTDVGGTSNVNNTSITVDPKTSKKTYGTPSGYTGINDVTVNAVTSAIDPNIAAGNIKKDVTILGVAGTYVKPDEPNLIAENIKKDVTIYGVTGSYEGAGPISFDSMFEQNVFTAISFNNSPQLVIYSMNRTFTDCVYLSNVDLSGLDTTGCVDFNECFSGCTGLANIDINTDGAESMNRMFKDCSSLSVDNFILSDTSNVTDMEGMFYNCSMLIDLSNITLDTSSVENFSDMFNGCTALEELPVFDTSSATEMAGMFAGVQSLSTTALDNILQMCIGATSYDNPKTLTELGLEESVYSQATIEALTHYADFVAAGWSTGYEESE